MNGRRSARYWNLATACPALLRFTVSWVKYTWSISEFTPNFLSEEGTFEGVLKRTSIQRLEVFKSASALARADTCLKMHNVVFARSNFGRSWRNAPPFLITLQVAVALTFISGMQNLTLVSR